MQSIKNSKKMPNFLIIGAAKSGTTSLFYYLRQHPEIYMPIVKETNFFALEGEKKIFCGPGDDTDTNIFSITDIKDYSKLFNPVVGETAIGEASPMYLYSSKAPVRIKYYIPDAKLIVVLRNPIERAYSNYLHMNRGNSREMLSFEKALESEKSRIEKNWQWMWHYTHVGFYYQQLQRYFDIFSNNQIKIILYEDFLTNPQKIVNDIFDFLGVNTNFMPDLSVAYNRTGEVKYQFINSSIDNLVKNNNYFVKLVKHFVSREKGREIITRISNFNLKPSPQMAHETKLQLISTYKADILQLQKLINRDLSEWLI